MPFFGKGYDGLGDSLLSRLEIIGPEKARI